MKVSRGFTLIELLIAISIIAILSVIGLGIYQSVYKSSRDAKRRSDLKFIQSALEQYHADQKYFPFTVTPGQEFSFTNSVGKKFIYMNKVPQDPAPPPDYSYQAIGTNCSAARESNCSSYCLYARLENTTNIVSDSACSSPSDNRLNYGITRP